jgi:glycosyltransferase involved in cell wall biosynthesis
VLNVLQVIPTLDRSGAEKQMVLLAEGLPRDRFRVEVAALTRRGPLEADLRAAGVEVTTIAKRYKVDPLALARLVRLMKAKRFDVVQTWIFAANTYGRLAARAAGVPVVVTAEMAVDLWKGKGQLAIDRRLAGWTDRVVGNSNAVVAFYRKAGIPEARLAMIPSGIGDEEPPAVDPKAVRADLGWPEGAPLVLFAGRLAAQKGVDDLLAALDLVRHVRPDVRTLIVGDGPLRGRLEETAHAFNLDRQVRFLGHRDDVPRLMAAADLVVLPSLYEGLPNVVLEAMRSRKPVVATAAPGTTEVVDDGRTGLLVPYDPERVAAFESGLAARMGELLADPDRAAAMGAAGRERVLTEFGWPAIAQQTVEVYSAVLAARG